MGVLYDYFHAADEAAVRHLMTVTDGGPMVNRPDRLGAVDGMDANGIDPDVVLGQLVAFARDVPWTPDLVGTDLVWPEPCPSEYGGPWVTQLSDDTRDALADLADDQLPSLAAEWGQIEELSYGRELPPDAMLPVLTELVALARRAQTAGNRLYCWICL